jgi:hypothetical protein
MRKLFSPTLPEAGSPPSREHHHHAKLYGRSTFMVFLPVHPGQPLDAQHPHTAALVASPALVPPFDRASHHPPSLVEALRLPALPIFAEVSLENRVQELQNQIAEHTGSRVVFDREKLSEGDYYDKLPHLSSERQERAAEIALREVRKYPPGFFEKLGLKTFGIFEACNSNSNDGFHVYDPLHEGY